MEHLIPMTDFVLEQEVQLRKNIHENYNNLLIPRCCDAIFNYANFLKQPLKLEMFVPCDEEGNVLFNPFADDNDAGTDKEYKQTQYNKAKSKVLFEAIEFRKNAGVNFLTIKEDTFAFFDFNVKFKNLTVEFLVQYNLQLTETAKKEIGYDKNSN